MGHVYEAWDLALKETIALKVVRREFANNPEADARFKRELSLARHVTHKNVVRIYDLGQIDDVTYISMALVDGVDLATMLKRGKLPPDRALSVTRQLCDGLAAAHEAGVVHRDLKPSNVMIDRGGQVYLLDFGLARSVDASGFTQAGAFLGTIEYLSPEQAVGEIADRRSDIYALGLILYELHTGEQPFKGETAMSRLSERLQKPAPDPRAVCPEMPAHVARIITRCLERTAAARYQSVEEILTDFDAPRPAPVPLPFPGSKARRAQLAVAVVVLGALAGGGYIWRHVAGSRTSSSTIAPAPVSVAILPFRNASGDQDLEWLGLTLPEMIRAEIGYGPGLRIVSSDRLFQILRDLRVPPAVELDNATFRRVSDLSSSDILISGQYMRLYTRSGSAIRVDATLGGRNLVVPTVLTVDAPAETDISQAVRTLVRSLRAAPALARIAGTATAAMPEPLSASMPALGAYTEGLQLARQGNDLGALKQFKAATEADPEFALAFAELARSYSRSGSAADAAQTARHAVDLSVKLPPHQRHLVEGISAAVANNTDKRIQAYESLARISPDDSQVFFDLASLYEGKGALERASDALAKVLEQDPKYAEALLAMARIEIRRGYPEAAFDPLNRALAVTNSTENLEAKANSLQAIGVAYKRIGRPEQALRCYQDSLEIKRKLGAKRGMTASLREIAQVQGMLGNLREAEHSGREALALLREVGDKSGLANGLINFAAQLNDTLGRPDEALPLLQEALLIVQDTDNENLQAQALNNIGGVYSTKGQYAEARTYFERALQLREKGKTPRETADTLHNLAETLSKMGRYDQALSHYFRALELRRSSGDRRFAAIESYSVGALYDYQGRYGAAVKSRGEALTTYRDLKQRDMWLGEILSGYGYSQSLSGQMETAAKTLDEALSVAREIKNPNLVAQTIRFQANRLYFSGDVKGANRLAEDAVEAASKASDHSLALLAQADVAMTTAALQPSKSLASKLVALARQADSNGLKFLSVDCSIRRAETLLKLGDRANALQEVERALAKSETIGVKLLQAKAHYLRGEALRSANDSEARRDYGSALRLLEEIKSDDGNQNVLKRSDLAAMYAECTRWSTAVQTLPTR